MENNEIRLIDANKIGLTDFEILMCNGDYKEGLEMILQKIENAPTIDAVPVVHGKWLWYEDCSNSGLYCSACHKLIHKVMTPKKKLSNYCPNCGAKMDGRKDDG